jgi:membrane-associated protein
MIMEFIDTILHLDQHLAQWTQDYGTLIYGILFLIIFCETGLVVTPFLPGDSLLFALGALCASGSLDLVTILVSLSIAAIIGDTLNYWIGKWIGPRAFQFKKSFFFNPDHLRKAHAFYEKHGGKTIVMARFVPIVRTFAPFVAGIGNMDYKKFLFYNVTGGIFWIVSLTILGYFFGNLQIVKENFTAVIFAIIGISVLPIIIELIRNRKTIEKTTEKIKQNHEESIRH